MITKAQQKATTKYMKKAYDTTVIRFYKGQRDKIKAYAEKNGESLNAYINRLISEDMQKHGEPLSTAPPSLDS